MAPYETVITDKMVVACDGTDAALGHPRVYLNLAPSGKIECPYCSRVYVKRSLSPAAHGAAPEPAVRRPEG
jgi:uncharacterized Zn-finger protein